MSNSVPGHNKRSVAQGERSLPTQSMHTSTHMHTHTHTHTYTLEAPCCFTCRKEEEGARGVHKRSAEGARMVAKLRLTLLR